MWNKPGRGVNWFTLNNNSMLKKAEMKNLDGILYLYRLCVKEMNRQGLFNWNTAYPSGQVVSDIEKGNLYIWSEDEIIVSALALDRDQPEGYTEQNWKIKNVPYLVVHRLAVLPGLQNKGIGEKVMKDVIRIARQLSFKSIRLDVFTGNPGAVRLYEKLGYSGVGDIHFSYQKVPFRCLEMGID